MTYKLGSPTGLMNHWGLFELSCKNGRFLAIFSVFRPKIGDLWPFDPNKRSSYKLLPSIITYSEGIVARQWESLEKGVTDDRRGRLFRKWPSGYAYQERRTLWNLQKNFFSCPWSVVSVVFSWWCPSLGREFCIFVSNIHMQIIIKSHK